MYIYICIFPLALVTGFLVSLTLPVVSGGWNRSIRTKQLTKPSHWQLSLIPRARRQCASKES